MTSERMSWEQLLDDTRIRKALEGTESIKAQDESRSEFERDRDRTVYSNPVRRLIGKTQVFPLNPNDHIRTRLIHSLEVSTVAEGLASQVVQEINAKREALPERQQRAIAKIAETCGLLHDLGNPPFGHAGELAIASWFEEKRQHDEHIEIESDRFFFPMGGPASQRAMDLLHFEGNAQTMRIITNTRLLGDDHGLNLTCATTAAARKYIASSLTANRKGPNHAYAKPGYFASEADIFRLVSQRTGAEERYPSEEPHLDSGALLLLSSPRRGGEGGEALDGNVSNTWQDGGQVVADRNLHPAAALHDRQNRRHLRSGLLAADVDPVLPAQRHGTHRVLRQIVAQLQFRVLQEACELLPQGERVVCRLPQRARR